MAGILGGLKPRGTACRVCGEPKEHLSRTLGLCLDCVRDRPDEALPIAREVHGRVRERHGLPGSPPNTTGGVRCGLCSNGCSMGEGERGYCGLRRNEGGLRSMVDRSRGLVYSYLDPHPTNCCSAWFCPAGTGSGYPRYANRPGPEYGFSNLAVFLYGCNFDCLYCQNSSHKDLESGRAVDADGFVERVIGDTRISCVCFFGGSPEPQLPFAIETSERLMELSGDRVLRICFEWNGCGNTALAMRAAELALESGGNVKFDLKCFTPSLSLALSGVENGRAYENFSRIAEELYQKRREIPVLTATTLLVPGYVDAHEVETIASFIAERDASIPYSLLVFHPAYAMSDLPITPLSQALECYIAAADKLTRVHVGNLHLLGLRGMGEFISMTRGLEAP